MIFSYQLLVISYQLLVISYQLLVISYQLLVISYQLLVISYQLLVVSCQLLVISCQLLVISYQLLVFQPFGSSPSLCDAPTGCARTLEAKASSGRAHPSLSEHLLPSLNKFRKNLSPFPKYSLQIIHSLVLNILLVNLQRNCHLVTKGLLACLHEVGATHKRPRWSISRKR